MGSQGALALEQGFVSASQVGQILAATIEGVSSALAVGSGGLNGGNNTNTNPNNDFDVRKAIKMKKDELKNNIPNDWTYTENNGFVHIKDANGNIRIRIDPADSVTNYQHMHLYDSKGNSLDSAGNIVKYKDTSAHIPYNN